MINSSFFFKNVREKNGTVNINTTESESKSSSSVDVNLSATASKAPSSISTVTPSTVTPSTVTPKFNYQSDLPETPILNKKFDINALRMKCGMQIDENKSSNNHQKNKRKDTNNGNNNPLNDSLGSIPRLMSPKISLRNKHNDNKENQGLRSNGLQPITPYQIKTTPQNLLNNKTNKCINNKTPITVSSFSVRKSNNDNDDDDDINMKTVGSTNNDKYGMSYIQKTEFDGIPSWITSKLGTTDEINKVIDIINNALKSMDGRISKSAFGDLIGKNETSFILLLTRTNRLKTDWFQGNSVYCLK
mmetsp:Transcript_6695/g.5961  ORF Transcript_6695/g.5961 Transcript_6695/m.5961 type:complete len:303 (-) Transcript_6695:460-1368(-)